MKNFQTVSKNKLQDYVFLMFAKGAALKATLGNYQDTVY